MKLIIRIIVGSLASLGVVRFAEPYMYFEGLLAVGVIASFAVAGALAWLEHGK